MHTTMVSEQDSKVMLCSLVPDHFCMPLSSTVSVRFVPGLYFVDSAALSASPSPHRFAFSISLFNVGTSTPHHYWWQSDPFIILSLSLVSGCSSSSPRQPASLSSPPPRLSLSLWLYQNQTSYHNLFPCPLCFTRILNPPMSCWMKTAQSWWMTPPANHQPQLTVRRKGGVP